MEMTNAIDCNGLSAAPTILRIKQALVGRCRTTLPIQILVDAECDRDHLRRSLGRHVNDVRLVARSN